MSDKIDIMDIQPSDKTISIKHPKTLKPIGFSITLRPLSSDAVQATVRDQQDRRLQLAARNKSFTAEDLEKNGLDLIISAIVGWQYDDENMTIEGGQPAFNPDVAQRLLRKAGWIFQQLDEALGDTSRFFQ